MPISTIPLWGQVLSNGLNTLRDLWKTSKERYNSMTKEQKADSVRKGNEWVAKNVLPGIITLGEMIPQTSIPMAAYATSEAKTPEERFQHIMMPIMMGSVGKGTGVALKASEKAIDASGRALKNTDNYITIQNALRTGKLRFGEPTTYTGIHQSKTPLTKVEFPFQRWDVTTHGADPNGFWLTLADEPNTTGTMASRPYASRWSATSQKPLIQTGEVKGLLGKKNNTRNAIVKYGRKQGADAFEFRGIKDNAVPQTDVLMVTEGTNSQYLGEFTEGSYISPKTSYKSIFMEEPIMVKTINFPNGKAMYYQTEDFNIHPEWDGIERISEMHIGPSGRVGDSINYKIYDDKRSIPTRTPIKITPLTKDADYYNWKVNRQSDQVLNGTSGSLGISRKEFDRLPAEVKWNAILKFFTKHKPSGEHWYLKQGGKIKSIF